MYSSFVVFRFSVSRMSGCFHANVFQRETYLHQLLIDIPEEEITHHSLGGYPHHAAILTTPDPPGIMSGRHCHASEVAAAWFLLLSRQQRVNSTHGKH